MGADVQTAAPAALQAEMPQAAASEEEAEVEAEEDAETEAETDARPEARAEAAQSKVTEKEPDVDTEVQTTCLNVIVSACDSLILLRIMNCNITMACDSLNILLRGIWLEARNNTHYLQIRGTPFMFFPFDISQYLTSRICWTKKMLDVKQLL